MTKLMFVNSLAMVVLVVVSGCNLINKPKPAITATTLAEKSCIAFGGTEKIKRYSYNYSFWDLGSFGSSILNYETISVVCKNGQIIEMENHIQ